MTNRERFIRFMKGEEVDRPLCWHGDPRESTFRAWMRQGLKEEHRANWTQFVREDRSIGIGKVDSDAIPRFEKRVLEKKGDKIIWIDPLGAKRLDHIDPATPGFVTRSYLEFPVKDRDDFLEMKKRYNPRSPERFLPPTAEAPAEDPMSWKFDPGDESIYLNRGEITRDSTELVRFVARGLFWKLRDWCGFEGLCLMFYDQPDLVHEMMDFWTAFLIDLCDPVLSVCKGDVLVLNEDMAYKHQSMISISMMREFMVPRYKRLIEFFKTKGVEFVVMDSDGHNSQILEAFMPEGLDGIQPMEIAANNDPATYLRQFPTMITWGGIDKRELRFDKARTRAEVVKRFEAQRKYGRYIPQVDHGVPPDIPIRNFLYMVELIRGLSRGEGLKTYDPPCELEKQLGPIEEMFDPATAHKPEEDGHES